VPFSITAELLLGTYRGHSSDGGVERIPSVARLHSALLCAAGFGPRAEQHGTGLAPSDADDSALRWLEENPPDAVSIPALRVNRGGALAYRDDGTFKRSKIAAAIKKFPKRADSSVAVHGHFTWTWSETPPPPVVTALEALCPDVPYLGTTETPVRLTSSRTGTDPTHTLDPNAGLFTGNGEDIDVPVTGRVEELMAAHAAARGRVPTVKQDATTADERSASRIPPRSAARAARYTPVRAAIGEVPWPEILVVPLDRRIPERDKVRWAVAAHRALIRSVGDGAPPLLTGAYPPGVACPTNRLALHFLDAGRPAGISARSALAVLLPRDADQVELGAVLGALRNLTSIRGPGGAVARLGHAEYRSGEQFWPQKPPGTVRLWQTTPPAVPDTRGHSDWTFAHAALLSLGFVWQNSTHLPGVPGRGDARYRAIVAAVNDAGAAAVAVEPLRTSAVHDYAHRVHPHAVVRPYRVTLAVGSLGGNRTVQAIGQSRHLGGGLLVPIDLPEGTVFEAGTALDAGTVPFEGAR
jgi:CRISPR-associated protein Csb2